MTSKIDACKKWVSTFSIVPVSAAVKLWEYSNYEDFTEVTLPADDEFEPDSYFPMWSTMWCFTEAADENWFDCTHGIQILSECGFRVYRSEDFGLVFGIDGCGYNFYENHWLPLYQKRGLLWHDAD